MDETQNLKHCPGTGAVHDNQSVGFPLPMPPTNASEESDAIKLYYHYDHSHQTANSKRRETYTILYVLMHKAHDDTCLYTRATTTTP